MDFIEFIIQLCNIPLSTSVLVQFLCSLYECVFRHKGKENQTQENHQIFNKNSTILWKKYNNNRYTKFNEGIRSGSSFNLSPINTLKFILKVFKVLKGKFLWIGTVTHCQVTHTTFNDITKNIGQGTIKSWIPSKVERQ